MLKIRVKPQRWEIAAPGKHKLVFTDGPCQQQCSFSVIVSWIPQGQFSDKFFCAVTPSSAAHDLPLQLQLICCPTSGSACKTHKRSSHPGKTQLQIIKPILFSSKLALRNASAFMVLLPSGICCSLEILTLGWRAASSCYSTVQASKRSPCPPT